MRCPKPKVRGSINQLLPTGPLGTGDLGMGRVVLEMKSILRASAYHRTVGFVEPPVQGLLILFFWGGLLLVAFYDMQGIQRTYSNPGTAGVASF